MHDRQWTVLRALVLGLEIGVRFDERALAEHDRVLPVPKADSAVGPDPRSDAVDREVVVPPEVIVPVLGPLLVHVTVAPLSRDRRREEHDWRESDKRIHEAGG